MFCVVGVPRRSRTSGTPGTPWNTHPVMHLYRCNKRRTSLEEVGPHGDSDNIIQHRGIKDRRKNFIRLLLFCLGLMLPLYCHCILEIRDIHIPFLLWA